MSPIELRQRSPLGVCYRSPLGVFGPGEAEQPPPYVLATIGPVNESPAAEYYLDPTPPEGGGESIRETRNQYWTPGHYFYAIWAEVPNWTSLGVGIDQLNEWTYYGQSTGFYYVPADWASFVVQDGVVPFYGGALGQQHPQALSFVPPQPTLRSYAPVHSAVVNINDEGQFRIYVQKSQWLGFMAQSESCLINQPVPRGYELVTNPSSFPPPAEIWPCSGLPRVVPPGSNGYEFSINIGEPIESVTNITFATGVAPSPQGKSYVSFDEVSHEGCWHVISEVSGIGDIYMQWFATATGATIRIVTSEAVVIAESAIYVSYLRGPLPPEHIAEGFVNYSDFLDSEYVYQAAPAILPPPEPVGSCALVRTFASGDPGAYTTRLTLSEYPDPSIAIYTWQDIARHWFVGQTSGYAYRPIDAAPDWICWGGGDISGANCTYKGGAEHSGYGNAWANILRMAANQIDFHANIEPGGTAGRPTGFEDGEAVYVYPPYYVPS